MNFINLLKLTFCEMIGNLIDDLTDFFDDSSGLLFPNVQPDYIKYMNLSIDKSVESILKEDLPQEFCDRACNEIDIFRRKTVNEKDEWIIYLDFKTGEVLDYIKGVGGEVIGEILESRYYGRKIVAIHNHPKGYLSPPSYDNFGILRFPFQDYEIICSEDEFWILEAKGVVNNRDFKVLKKNIKALYYHSFDFAEDDESLNLIYERNLLKYLNNKININLIKKEYK